MSKLINVNRAIVKNFNELLDVLSDCGIDVEKYSNIDECKAKILINEINKKRTEYNHKNRERRNRTNKKYYENHREEILEKAKYKYQQDKVKVSEKRRKYYEKNCKEIIKKSLDRYYKNNDGISKKRKQYNKKYYELHKEELRAYYKARYQKRKSAEKALKNEH